MASGCPVINTHIPASGVSWVSQHEKTGLTTRVGDVEAFAAAANRILNERGLRQALSETAQMQAAERFSDTTMAARTLGIYAGIVNRSLPEMEPLVIRPASGFWSHDLPLGWRNGAKGIVPASGTSTSASPPRGISAVAMPG